MLFGPTGGYIFGFVLAAGCIGLLTDARKPAWILGIAAGLAGLFLIYACGLASLMYVLQVGWGKALVVGFAPFIIQDLVKLLLAVAMWRFLHQRGLIPR